MAVAASITDNELHGLVDGCLPADRRADVLRRLAGSAPDRARVEAWQEQNDLIKAAFCGVDKETLPPILDLRAPPRLHCVPTFEAPLLDEPIVKTRRPFAGHAKFLAVACMIVFSSLGALWLVVQPATTVSPTPEIGLRGSVDAHLATRAEAAVAEDGGADPAAQLPTARIPDLTPSGFILTRVETQAAEPASLVFHYRNAAHERVAVSVARAPQAGASTRPAAIAKAYGWRSNGNVYAIAGTVQPDRLQTMAVSLQRDDIQE